jgi:uncharacterized damage-inducible protein DinB
MPEDRDELLNHYRSSREQLLTAIDGLTTDQMSEQTIDGWAVKDHLAHIALWDDLRAAEVERVSAGHDSAWKMSEEQDDAFNDAGYQIRRSMSAAQARWELENSRRKLLDAIAVAPPEALDISRYGAAGLRSDHEDQHVGWIQRWRAEKGY